MQNNFHRKNVSDFWTAQISAGGHLWCVKRLRKLAQLSPSTHSHHALSELEELNELISSIDEDKLMRWHYELKLAWSQHKFRMKKKQNRERTFSTTLPDDTISKIKQIAQIKGMTISDLITEVFAGKYKKLERMGKIPSNTGDNIGFTSQFTENALNEPNLWNKGK